MHTSLNPSDPVTFLNSPDYEALGLPFSEMVRVGDLLFLSGQMGNLPGVLALAPGIDPAALQLTVDKGLLVVAGERKAEQPANDNVAVYAKERFEGAFRRVISLPEDADPAAINASYRDGLLRVTVARRESSKPRQIQIH